MLRTQTTAQPQAGTRMSLERRVQWAEQLGIIECITRRRDETDISLELRRGARERALQAADAGRMRTMLGWVQDFLAAMNRPRLFAAGEGGGDRLRANAEVLASFGEFMRRAGSKRKGSEGGLLKTDGIQSIVAMARQLQELTTHGAVVDPSAADTSVWGYRTMRRGDGPSDARRTRRALRAAHFRRAASAGLDRTSPHGRGAWAAALMAHNALLRGGEVGVVGGRAFDAALDMTWRSITWCLPCADSRGRMWLILWVVPIKYRAMRNQVAHPIPIVRRLVGGAVGEDALCAYDALWLHWVSMWGGPPTSARQDWQGRLSGGRIGEAHPLATASLFVGASGKPWDTADSKSVARSISSACGENPDEFGASSMRSGGGTDLREVLGDGSMSIVKQRGRWASDIAEIYQRALLLAQLDGSGAMASATGADMEAVCAGWSQPTSF